MNSTEISVILHFSTQELYLYASFLEKNCLKVLPKWSPSELTCLKEALATLNLYKSLKKTIKCFDNISQSLMKGAWRTASRPPSTLQWRGQEAEPGSHSRTLQIHPVCPHPNQMDLARTQSFSESERVSE